MEKLFSELVDITREQNSIGIWTIISLIATILSPLISLAATIIAFVVMKNTISKNQDDIKANRESQLLNSQHLYPLLTYDTLESHIFDSILWGRLTPKALTVVSIKTSQYEIYEILVNNGITENDKKPAAVVPFTLSNSSDAIIAGIKLDKLILYQPKALKEKQLRLEAVEYIPEHDMFQMQELLKKGDNINVALSIYLDNEEYVKYFSKEHVSFRMFLSLEIITGLSFQQIITVDGGSKARYTYGDSVLIEPCFKSVIYIK